MLYRIALKEQVMKLPTNTIVQHGFNTFTLTGLSLLWATILGYINPWFTPLTIFCLMIGYGSEVRKSDTDKASTINL